VRLDQDNLTAPWHHLIYLNQEQLLAGLLALPAYSASAKVICFIGILGQRDGRISPEAGSLLQDSLGMPGRQTH